jgi:hypothetical protein
MTEKKTRHWEVLTGHLELFLGAYIMRFGLLGLLYFARIHSRNGLYGSTTAVLIGMLLLLQARTLLAWHGWIFWLVVVVAVSVPVAWLTPAVLRLR